MTNIVRAFTALPAIFLCLTASATEPDVLSDSLSSVEARDVVVRSSYKETNAPWKTPNSLTVLSPFKINNRQINDIKDLSTVVPNFFIPEYGSKMVTPVYLRGVGTRSSGQSVGLYVDNIPYMDKSSFDFMLMDVQRIEVLRGPQGTLYGRNAMTGIVNVYTLSPFEYQGTKVSMGAGNFGLFTAKVSTYQKFSDKVAISAAAYWEEEKGYLENEFTNSNADGGTSTGGRIKLDWKINENLTAAIAASYDYTDENAYPYGLYWEETGHVGAPMMNERSTYIRNMSNNSARFEYRKKDILFTSNTGYQYLDDDMYMDQDFTEKSIFTLNQKQLQHSVNQEFTVKSNHGKNYQWSVGAFGFYNDMTTNSNVKLYQSMFDKMLPPTMPFNLKIQNSDHVGNPGVFETPSWGAAVFHQSTFNNVLTKGLSFTLGVRLDYEKQDLNYNTFSDVDFILTGKAPGMPTIDLDPARIEAQGEETQDFLRVLPRVSVKYECTPEIMTYFNASTGYRAGGYNVQMFSQILQDLMKNELMPGGKSNTNIKEQVAFKPETVWSFEVGSRGSLFDGLVNYDLAGFFMLVEDMQLTQFVDGGSGRIITNAGRGETAGVELALNVSPVERLNFDASYGFTHSTFTDYVLKHADGDKPQLDYNDNFVPYVPMHTFTIGANYTFNFNGWIEALTVGVNYNGAGKFFWNEANTVQQNFYGLLDAKVVLRSSWARLEFWGRNLTNTDYSTFYFESFGNKFMQTGRPTSFGVTLGFTI